MRRKVTDYQTKFRGGNKMKKATVMVVIILAMITLGSVCGAGDKSGDKKGYIVRSIVNVTLPPGSGSFGEAYCAQNDFVTGCSYLLFSYPGCTSLSDYSFPVVQPIGCSEDKEGFRVCTGCRVVMVPPHTDPLPANCSATPLPLEVEFWVYAYCSSPKH